MSRASALVFLASISLAGLGCGDSHSPGASSGGAGADAIGGATTGTSGSNPTSAGAGSSTGGAPSGAGSSAGGAESTEVSLLIFSKTAEYRHDSIPAGIQGLTQLAIAQGWATTATEDASRFNDSELGQYAAVIFLSTTGDVLDADQQAAFERFIRTGHGFVGIHAASDTEYDWAWYGNLVGAYFREHPAVQAADLLVEDAAGAATTSLPTPWRRTDEWYAFRANPRQNVHVLLSLDETSYAPGEANMGGDHPVAWRHEHDGGRGFYTALGHTSESYSDPLFLAHVSAGIEWVLAK